MKTFIQTVLSLSIAFIMVNSANAQTFKVNPEASSLEWLGKKVTGQHKGTINIKSGTVKMKDGALSGDFTIDMTSINNEDLEGEYKTKLENHLKSDDFFSVDKHPESTFKITSAKSTGNNTYEVTGDLTIKGITNSISFPATVTTNKSQLKASADITIDRTKWKVKYGSGSFFDDLGDKMIYDDIEFTLYLVAKK